MELPLFSETWIEFPVGEVEFEAHHTRGPGMELPRDRCTYQGILAVLWLARIPPRTAQHTLSASLKYFSKNDAVALL